MSFTRRTILLYTLIAAAAAPLCLLPLCSPGAAPPSKKQAMTVYFIPFGAQTMVPVTPENIVTGAEPIQVTSPAAAAEIAALVQKRAGAEEAAPAVPSRTFGEYATRLLVRWDERPPGMPLLPLMERQRRVYVDADGVAREGWRSWALPRDSFARLDTLLTRITERWAVEKTAKEERARPALAKAAQKNDLAEVRRLLAAGANPDIHDTQKECGMTPLMHAAYQGSVPACEALLRGGGEQHRGAEIETRDINGYTALTYAAMNRKRGTFDLLLLRRGASVKGIPGEQSLLYAAGDGELGMALHLLERGVNPDCRDTDEAATPLMRAAVGGGVATAQTLIRHGAGVNLRDEAGRTALTWAAIRDDDVMARTLLDSGAQVDSGLEAGGVTALTLAVRNGRVSTVRLLLGRGATVTRQHKKEAVEAGDEKIIALLHGR